jgi:hypothetical protein
MLFSRKIQHNITLLGWALITVALWVPAWYLYDILVRDLISYWNIPDDKVLLYRRNIYIILFLISAVLFVVIGDPAAQPMMES